MLGHIAFGNFSKSLHIVDELWQVFVNHPVGDGCSLVVGNIHILAVLMETAEISREVFKLVDVFQCALLNLAHLLIG